MWRPSFYSLLLSALFAAFLWEIHSHPETVPTWCRSSNCERVLYVIALGGFTTSLFFSFRSFFKFNAYRVVNLVFIAANILLICAGTYKANWAVMGIQRFVYESHVKEHRLLQNFSKQAFEEKSAIERHKFAKAAYIVFGVQISYLDSDGHPAAFAPTADDMAKREELGKSQSKAEKAEEYIIKISQRTPDNIFKIALAAGVYFIALLVGDLVFTSMALRKAKKQE